MNKLFAVVPLVIALSACKQEPPPAPAPEAPASAVAPTPAPAESPAAAPAAPTSTSETPAAPAVSTAAMPDATALADLPKECQDYLDKVSACVAKQSGPAAEEMKATLEQTKASWTSMGADKAQLGSACKTLNEGFATQASAMQC